MRGITVKLFEKIQTGTDPLNMPIYSETPVEIQNVIVAPIESSEVVETYNLTGRKAVYQLGIPKDDTHSWQAGQKVEFFGQDWRIIAIPTEGIEELMPLKWNKKVKVESYE